MRRRAQECPPCRHTVVGRAVLCTPFAPTLHVPIHTSVICILIFREILLNFLL